MITIPVKCSADYNVLVGKGILDNAASLISEQTGGQGGKVCVFSDSNVSRLGYTDRLIENLSRGGISAVGKTFPAGEQSKTFATAATLVDFLAENHFTRTDTVVALGGGVTGDLSGFVSGIYLRGINYIGIPTTVLAAVDSSVGGKTGVDIPAGKNLAGVFHQPKLVLSDPEVFSTLSVYDYNSGVAEAIKYGIIGDRGLFSEFSGGGKLTEQQIAACIKAKADIVGRDEFESGERRLLNLGHTIGHALETLSEYKLPHGYAVAAGTGAIAAAFDLPELAELQSAFRAYSLPASIEEAEDFCKMKFPAEDIYNAALSDKKRSSDNITLVRPVSIGECNLVTVCVGDFLKLLRKIR
ncbi:3-dehydroquinate synthase [Clostridia bacterium]|nr:3-dehydroquinate synthase [Clostridia bacterium]